MLPLSLSPAWLLVSPYTPAPLPSLTFAFFPLHLLLLSSLLLLLLSLALASLYGSIMKSFLAEKAQHFLDACVLSDQTLGKRRGA